MPFRYNAFRFPYKVYMWKRRSGKCLAIFLLLTCCSFLASTYCLLRWNIICLNASIEVAINDLCASYLDGKAYGSLCSSLCSEQEVEILSCQPMHKGKSSVFTALWTGKKIVIKSHKTKNEYIPLPWKNENGTLVFPTPEEFYEIITHSLKTNCGLSFNSTSGLMGTLFPYITIPPVPSNDLMINLWQLVQDNEYVLSVIFKEVQIFPKVLGSCGNFYAVEYVSPFSQYDSEIGSQSANQVVGHGADSLVQLVKKLDVMVPERLELCDVKLEHFGWSQDGLLKILDADTAFLKSIADRITSDGRHCSDDSDCNLFDCSSSCNQERNICDKPLTNNNMERICQKILPSLEYCM